ncbi:MAG: hypothetical protein H0U16_07510 [Actinobacteria bacterium]|nr:hypothetical protein [Actinomycetota bacterium]
METKPKMQPVNVTFTRKDEDGATHEMTMGPYNQGVVVENRGWAALLSIFDTASGNRIAFFVSEYDCWLVPMQPFVWDGFHVQSVVPEDKKVPRLKAQMERL